MRPSVTLYSTLGLPPSASRDDVDAAYRSLIKRFHPDREGGDADRAAEINRAYAILRDPDKLAAFDRPPLVIAPRPRRARRRRSRDAGGSRRRGRRGALYVGLLLLGATGWVAAHPTLLADVNIPGLFQDPSPASATPRTDAMEQPIQHQSVMFGAQLGLRLAEQHSLTAAAQYSEDCQRILRLDASVGQLDQCLAFDTAVAMRAPEGSDLFNAVSTTSRQMAAARTLSDRFDLIEHRLDLIRNEVEVIAAQSYRSSAAPVPADAAAAPPAATAAAGGPATAGERPSGF